MKALIASIGFVSLGALVACGSGEDAGSTSPTSPTGTTATTPGHDMDSMGGSEHEVQMKLIAFQPEELEVAAGTEVTWSQKDAGFHTATSGTVTVDGSGEITTKPDGTFASEQMKTGETFSHTFEKAGTFAYFCEIHPATMRGEITVN